MGDSHSLAQQICGAPLCTGGVLVPRTLFGIKSSGVDSLDTDPFFIEPPPSWSKGRSPAGKQENKQ